MRENKGNRDSFAETYERIQAEKDMANGTTQTQQKIHTLTM